MASAISILINDNAVQDIRMLDSFTNCHIFEHDMAKHFQLLLRNSELITIDAKYDLRPDLLSYEFYGTNFWYPAILLVNKLGSVLQFKSEYLNNKCHIPNKDIILQILSGSK